MPTSSHPQTVGLIFMAVSSPNSVPMKFGVSGRCVSDFVKMSQLGVLSLFFFFFFSRASYVNVVKCWDIIGVKNYP